MRNWILGVGILLLVIMAMVVTHCEKKVHVTKKGLDKIRVVHKTDTVFKEKKVFVEGKTKFIVKKEVYYRTDTVQAGKYTVSVTDSIKGDTTHRTVSVAATDTTKLITKTDSVFITRVDTVFIKEKGNYWKGLKHGFAAGYVAGAVTGVALSR